MYIDYRKWPPGVALAAAIVLVRCPVCKKSAQRSMLQRGERYTHEVTIAHSLHGRARVVRNKKSCCWVTRGGKHRRGSGAPPRRKGRRSL